MKAVNELKRIIVKQLNDGELCIEDYKSDGECVTIRARYFGRALDEEGAINYHCKNCGATRQRGYQFDAHYSAATCLYCRTTSDFVTLEYDKALDKGVDMSKKYQSPYKGDGDLEDRISLLEDGMGSVAIQQKNILQLMEHGNAYGGCKRLAKRLDELEGEKEKFVNDFTDAVLAKVAKAELEISLLKTRQESIANELSEAVRELETQDTWMMEQNERR